MYKLRNFIDWLIGMLLVSRSGLVEEDAVEVFHYYGFHLSSSFLMQNFKPFQVNNNVVVFPIHLHIFMPLANLCLIRLQGQFPIPRTRSCPGLYPLIHPPKRLLALGRGRILIPGFIRSSPMLAVYYVAHCFPLGGVGNDFTE